jgi:flotillin
MEIYSVLSIGLGVAILVAAVILLMASLRVVVSTNEVRIVQSGRKTVSYGKDQPAGNTYYRWPSWVPVVGIRVTQLPVSVFDLRLDGYAAYDKGRVPFVIDIMAFFRITDSNMAAQRVNTTAELVRQLQGILQGVCRTILANSDIQDILAGRGQFGKMFTAEVDENLKQWGVQSVKQIELMDIRDAADSKVISNIMMKNKSTIEMESRVVVAGNMKTAQLAEVQANQEVSIRQQEAAEMVGIRAAQKDQQIGVASQKSFQAIKDEEKESAMKAQAVAEVQNVRSAEIARSVKLVEADQSRQTTIIAAEAQQKTAVIQAEGTKQQVTLLAEGQLAQAKLQAQGVEAQGAAQGAAETAVLMAPVTAQITLAKEIGANDRYQTYLISVRTIEKDQAVGIEQAKALEHADIKVIANTGEVVGGVTKVMDLFTTKGGTQLGGMMEALKQTPAGKDLIAKFTNGRGAEA